MANPRLLSMKIGDMYDYMSRGHVFNVVRETRKDWSLVELFTPSRMVVGDIDKISDAILYTLAHGELPPPPPMVPGEEG